MRSLMNILLTGSHGFIGKNVYELLKDKHWIQCLDTSIGKDIADCDLNYKDIDVVIHLAGSANVRDSLENPTKYWTNNVQNSKRLFDAFPNTRILYASSSTAAEPWANPYALSKKAMEMIAPPHALGMRFTTVYGPGGRPDMLIPRILRNELKYANINFSRDFIHVYDVVSAIEAFMLAPHMTGLADVGTGQSVKVLDIIDHFGLDVERVQGDTTLERVDNTADITRLTSMCWRPHYNVIKYISENKSVQ